MPISDQRTTTVEDVRAVVGFIDEPCYGREMASVTRLLTPCFTLFAAAIAGCYSQPSTEDTSGTSGSGESGDTSPANATDSSSGSIPDDDGTSSTGGVEDDGLGTSSTGGVDDTTGDTGAGDCVGGTESVLADWSDAICTTVDIYSCDAVDNCSIIDCNLGPADPGGWVRVLDPAMGEGVDLSPALEMGTIPTDGSRVTADLVVSVGDACNPRFVTRVACAGGDACSVDFRARVFDAAGDFSTPLDMVEGTETADGMVTDVSIDLAPFRGVAQLYIEIAMNTGTWDASDVVLFEQPRVVATD